MNTHLIAQLIILTKLVKGKISFPETLKNEKF